MHGLGNRGRFLTRSMGDIGGRRARRTLLVPLIAVGSLVSPSLSVLAAPSAAAGTSASPPTASPPLVLDETWSATLPDIGQPIALSSPTVADLGGSPSVVVADRRGYVYAYHLAGNAAVAPPGWPATDGSGPIDSSPSVAPGTLSSPGSPTVFVGSGNDADPGVGGYQAFTAAGSLAWFTPVTN